MQVQVYTILKMMKQMVDAVTVNMNASSKNT